MDSIHSDVFFIGTRHATGHVTFFPNYNTVQPGCPPMKLTSFYNFLASKFRWLTSFSNNFTDRLSTTGMCSHFNALRYFVDTLNPKFGHLFASTRCQSPQDFTGGRCLGGAKNFMGQQADPKVPGTFYVKLNTKQFFDSKNFYKYIWDRIGQRLSVLLGGSNSI